MCGVDTILPRRDRCCGLQDDYTDKTGEDERSSAELVDDVGTEQSEDKVYCCRSELATHNLAESC